MIIIYKYSLNILVSKILFIYFRVLSSFILFIHIGLQGPVRGVGGPSPAAMAPTRGAAAQPPIRSPPMMAPPPGMMGMHIFKYTLSIMYLIIF